MWNSKYNTDSSRSEDDIRRLTEIECERLQGFPDDWTKFGNYDGTVKEIPKTQRYKMLGNAVTVKVVEEIAKRLLLPIS
ncbi:DNA cytosine methyltransferase [Chryseobacterium taichungense]|uniref:DNA cytosine methyltransferase n=1 Tax=Chryseobacterium taichungense TaxID=295069 RepID=UPI0028B02246|nr:DNA cytosine methyltransferase [Chryseobacterium taichungense]